jgi:hypothetical protein
MNDLLAMDSPEVLRIDLGRGDDGALMTDATVDACLAFLAASDLTIVDLDGPPPELHPRFREIVILVRALRRRLVHRCNLALASQLEDGELPELLADHRVDVVAALPGRPSFEPTSVALLQGLRRLNAVGYGVPGAGLNLTLVVPAAIGEAVNGVSLDTALDAHGVRWSSLHVVPQAVPRGPALVGDLQRLAGSVHPARVLGLPARSTVDVAWDGSLSESLPDGSVLPLGRNVAEVRAVEELFAPIGSAFGLSAASAGV